MFASFAKISGFAAQWTTVTDERFILRTLSGDVHAIADTLSMLGLPAPAGKITMLRFLQGDALISSPIRGHASGAWALFCKAAAAALQGDRTLCDTFDADAAASKAAASKAAADKRASKAATTVAAAATTAAATAAAAVTAAATAATAAVAAAAAPAADPVAAALDVINAAVNAGTLTAAQVDYLRSMVERLAIKV